jgi:hypothetical protein
MFLAVVVPLKTMRGTAFGYRSRLYKTVTEKMIQSDGCGERRGRDAHGGHRYPSQVTIWGLLNHMEFAGDVGPPLALKECEGNESQPVDPRSKKENLSDRSGEQRKIGSYPIAKERRGEDDCWRTYRRIAISKRRQRTSAQCPRAVSR